MPVIPTEKLTAEQTTWLATDEAKAQGRVEEAKEIAALLAQKASKEDIEGIRNDMKGVMDDFNKYMAGQNRPSYQDGWAGKASPVPEQLRKAWFDAPTTSERMKKFREVLCTQPNEVGNGYNELKALTSDVEKKALGSYDDTTGGILIPPDIRNNIIVRLLNLTHIRQRAFILTGGPGVPITIPSFDYTPGIAWTMENMQAQQDVFGGVFGKTQLTPHEQARLIKIPLQLINNANIPIESFLLDWYMKWQPLIEENAFINGDGKDQPMGVLNRDASGNYMKGAATPEATAVTSDTDPNYGSPISPDDIWNVIYSLKAQYRGPGCGWLIPRAGIKAVRSLRSTTGQFLWGDGDLSKGQPPTLAGFPVMETEFFGAPIPQTTAPNGSLLPVNALGTVQNAWNTTTYTPVTGDPYLMFGDFSNYWIADGPAMKVLRLNELFALTRQVGYVLTKWCDGCPTIGEAFTILVK